ncbi:chemokine-like receptor 1 isoform X1 [Xiphophorus couchianus]|uniref:chemokine-like receptor 1 isoform X1 n=2 Tax=Xiphophorus couchianus TaxID=32473 RepID=UPI001015EF19|nr:chemokine-like receptor 1 isoform X1 [Xiphophorus couchianus]
MLRSVFTSIQEVKKLTMELDYIEYEDYTPINETENVLQQSKFSQASVTHVLAVVNIFISFFGLIGNAVVVWICGCKMKRTVITTWYISLALSDLFFCILLPFDVFYSLTSNWPFGQFLCKFISSALFLNMYSSVFLLVLISADRCVLVLFPVWANNHRTVHKAYGTVAVMWLLAGLLTLPSAIFRTTAVQDSYTKCQLDYSSNVSHKAVVLGRFFCGFLVPFLIIVFSCAVIGLKLRGSTIRSKRPYKIMVALILSFFFCWVPYHTFCLMEINFMEHNIEMLVVGLKVGATLAAANALISPIFYVFVGNDFKQTLKHSVMSKYEEAMAEDIHTTGFNQSRSKSMEIIETHTIS